MIDFKKFDDYVVKLPKSQKYLLYFLIVALFSGIAYNTIPGLIEKKDTLLSNIFKIQRNINNNRTLILKKALLKDRKIILQQQKKIDKEEEQINYLISQLYGLKFAFFDEKEWVSTLNKILKKSIIYNIKITAIKNDIVNNNKNNLIEVKKTITITGEGDYIDILRYINYIESLHNLFRFKKISIISSVKGLNFEIIFDAYGIGL